MSFLHLPPDCPRLVSLIITRSLKTVSSAATLWLLSYYVFVNHTTRGKLMGAPSGDSAMPQPTALGYDCDQGGKGPNSTAVSWPVVITYSGSLVLLSLGIGLLLS